MTEKGSETETLRVLDGRFAAVCRMLLGKEVGGLRQYEGWLMPKYEKLEAAKSSLSGRSMFHPSGIYPKNSSWIAHEEVDFTKSFPPLGINEMKDIDSVAEAVRERVVYCGGAVLGNSGFVAQSTNITDSYYLFHCSRIAFSKYIAYGVFGSLSEDMYGCYSFGTSSHCIGGAGQVYSHRCMEISASDYCSDCYYSHHLSNCQDCMFSFHLKGKRNCIGNAQLEKEKYQKIRASLLEQMRSELESKGKLPTLLELFFGSLGKPLSINGLPQSEPQGQQPAPAWAESAFSKVTRTVLGKELSGIDQYGKWLWRHVRAMEPGRTVGGADIMVPHYADFEFAPRERLLDEKEANWFGQNVSIGKEKAEKLDFASVPKSIGGIACLCPQWLVGQNGGLSQTPISIGSQNMHRSVIPMESKVGAYSFLQRNSDNAFGCNIIRNSSMCIKCFDSAKLNRCFEVDTSDNCADSYFLHNCENVRDSMFCFNVKNMANAIGNAQLPLEQYKQVKSALLGQMTDELQRTKKLHLDIFNIGTQG
jgi:hypothetical protein